MSISTTSSAAEMRTVDVRAVASVRLLTHVCQKGATRHFTEIGVSTLYESKSSLPFLYIQVKDPAMCICSLIDKCIRTSL